MDAKVSILDYMKGNDLQTRIYWHDNGKVEFENFTDDIVARAFGVLESPVGKNELYNFFIDRCFPETRGNCKRVLKSIDVPFYEPYLIVKKTNGLMFDDCYWIRFEGEENLKYEELREKWGL